MTELVASIAVAVAWAVATFTGLQLITARRRRAVAALAGIALLGVALAGTRTGNFGYGWLRSQQLQSDALAIGALVPTIAVAVAAAVARELRATWALAATLTAAGACATAGLAALAIGRAGWYWEFAAIMVAGLTLLIAGIGGAVGATGRPNHRVVAGGVALFGAFLASGGALLLAAWTALA
ncbi:MAG: hypothetical protein JWO69_1762 [Thermoleophilia bacterium]|nr:hypothetical protein [Thermoleophilia bacterium]